MRQLATIRKISAIDPIPDADKIEVCTVDGWKVVSQKGLYSPGDLVVYCEIDSWIPATVAPFLCEHLKAPREYNGVPGERLRTKKMRGQISQGLLLPLKSQEIRDAFSGEPVVKEGDDVTEVLGIQLWEKPISAQMAGVIKGSFPSFIPKTDQERVQNLKKHMEGWMMEGGLWEVTEKVNGSSMTVYVNGDEQGVCSRNNDLKFSEENSFWRVAIKYNLIDKIKLTDMNLAFQGELVGEGVQGNKYGFKGLTFLLFDIYDIDRGEYFSPSERTQMADKFDVTQVPFVAIEPITKSMDWYLDYAEGKSQLNPTVEREGVVFRWLVDRKSFKVINNVFLLKHDE
jgi:RNA ligase (TIGR02306 family)